MFNMEKLEFKNYDLTITLTPFINIVGTMGSGKTKLLKNLINKIPNDNIFIDGKSISSYDIDFLRKNIEFHEQNVEIYNYLLFLYK